MVQQVLEVFDISDGSSQSLHLAETLVSKLLGQVVSEARVALIHTTNPLPLPLVPLSNEGRLKRVVIDSYVPRKGQVREPS